MKNSVSPAIPITIILLLTHFNQVQSNTSLIAQTCKQTPNYNLCYTTLASDPRSSKADVQGLALIMVSIIKAKATKALGIIKYEIKKHPALKQPLSACATYYDAILTADIPEAIEALQKGDPKFAQDGTNDAAIEVNSCQANFHGKASPLTSLNKVVHENCVVAASIIRQLL